MWRLWIDKISYSNQMFDLIDKPKIKYNATVWHKRTTVSLWWMRPIDKIYFLRTWRSCRAGHPHQQRNTWVKNSSCSWQDCWRKGASKAGHFKRPPPGHARMNIIVFSHVTSAVTWRAESCWRWRLGVIIGWDAAKYGKFTFPRFFGTPVS